jgi:hypothetical protein
MYAYLGAKLHTRYILYKIGLWNRLGFPKHIDRFALYVGTQTIGQLRQVF